jgi:hydrogenase expression/formation protein HypD
MLVSHVLVPPAIEAMHELARQPRAGVPGRRPRVQRDGHVGVYDPLAERYHVPIVVTGFEPLDVLEGIRRTVLQLERGRPKSRTPTPRRAAAGQPGPPRQMLADVFAVTDRNWRGIGLIPQSGWRLSALPRL